MSHSFKKTFAALVFAAISGLSMAPVNASPLVPVNKACFFRGIGFTGPVTCFEARGIPNMPTPFSGYVGSIRIIGDVSATLCTSRITHRNCKTFNQDVWQVPSPLHNATKSVRVQRNRIVGAYQLPTLPTATMYTILR